MVRREDVARCRKENRPFHDQHPPATGASLWRPTRLRKGSRFEDTYPISYGLQAEEHAITRSRLASPESPFQFQEYIAHLVRADPHAVHRIISLPSPLVPPEVWIYEQLRRLALDLSHPLVSALQAECNRDTCPEMKAGEWLYLCAAHTAANENECCAIDYVIHTLDGATALLNSGRYFPSRLQIPPGSVKHFTSIARRLYRILAHAWFHHRELFEQCEMETSLYARFMALSDEFDLVAEDLLVIPRVIEEDNHHDRGHQQHKQYDEPVVSVGARHYHHQPTTWEEQESSKLHELSSALPIVHHLLSPIDNSVVLDPAVDKHKGESFQLEEIST
ncbi:hypothetical protein PtB15_1B278 [Puccinia triticina]|nr:hypothetical protein PtB15_1B278 [Puccinia triticina]